MKLNTNKILLTLLSLLIACTSFAQRESGPTLSANTKQYLWKQKNLYANEYKILPECVYREDAIGNIYLASLIKVDARLNTSDLKALDIMIGSKSKDIWTVYIPLDKVESFTKIRGIVSIELDRPIGVSMDEARKKTHADSVHAGINLPQAYDGSDVVVGIIDGGFDYGHPTFFDTTFSSYRLKSVWEQKTTGTPPTSYNYGAEYTDSATIFDAQTDNANYSHGAHVAGIAGGSGYGGPNGDNRLYRGMAYNSDLVFVGILPTTNHWLNTGLTDLMDGINYVYDYASTVNKPAVANISWGGPIGSHDGLSLFSQGCDNATGAGKLLTFSAGNNAGKTIHIGKTFTSSDTVVSSVVSFSGGLPSKTNWIDIWGDTAQSFCIQFELRARFVGQTAVSNTYCLDDSTHQIHLIKNGDTCFVTLTTVSSDINGKAHMLVDIDSRVLDDVVISVSGQSGTINMWQGYIYGARGYYPGFFRGIWPDCVNGDDAMTSTDMASTISAIAVGAYTSKASFTNISNQTLSFGQTNNDLANFSSLGPTADGRSKPNITGPGTAIASSVNSQETAFQSGGGAYNLVANNFVSPLNGTTYSYAFLQGTSMSSPAVAGILALMLQANPNLDPTQVKNILYSTAIQDIYTGNIPATGDNEWGWGKINAYAAVAASLTITGIYHEERASLQGLLYPNPSNGNYTIELQIEQAENIQITLADINGRVLDSKEWTVSEGINSFQPAWDHLAAGVYFVRLKGETGEMNIKLVKE